MASVVGVELPGAELGAASKVVIIVALAACGVTSAVVETAHESRPGVAKSLRPQFTAFSTVGRKADMVVVATVHFDVAPQPALPHDMPVRSSCIEPERSN